jgi:hypothetical protein
MTISVGLKVEGSQPAPGGSAPDFAGTLDRVRLDSHHAQRPQQKPDYCNSLEHAAEVSWTGGTVTAGEYKVTIETKQEGSPPRDRHVFHIRDGEGNSWSIRSGQQEDLGDYKFRNVAGTLYVERPGSNRTWHDEDRIPVEPGRVYGYRFGDVEHRRSNNFPECNN